MSGLLLTLLALLNIKAQFASSCQFPEDLRGVWISSDKGFLRFADSVIYNYPVSLPGTSSIDLLCAENNGTHYMLKSSQDIDVFSLKVSIYICLSFVRVTQNNYVYYIGAPLDPMVKERVFAMSNLLNVSMDQVCTLPNTDDNVFSLRKNVSVSDIDSTGCPKRLKNAFVSLSIEETGVTNKCANGIVNGCVKDNEIVISTSSCHSNAFISNYLSLICLFHKTIDQVTYVYTWTEDTSFQSIATHGFICVEFTHNETWTTLRLFNDTCRDSLPSLNFLTLNSNQTNDTCLPTTPVPPPIRNTNRPDSPKGKKNSTNWAIYFAIVVCIIIIIGFIIIIIKFFRKEMFDFFAKKPRQPEPAVSFSNIAAKSTETLNTTTTT
uniref:Uncharacterized protein LOC111123559 n=1 Tax=Crassostrea virginica TaxID=6565 RepID=A0A8B8D2E0_CRAVI|nr:uncharacterized protein LOC111123559 [Crassostrea virginica]